MNPFDAPGHWYKTALHVHTTRSDGKLNPPQAVQAYRDHGYQVVALTDHRVITDVAGLSRDGLLCIPSVEVDYDQNPVRQSYHVCVIGVREMIELPRLTPIQQAIDRWAEPVAGQAAPLLFLAHTYWSGMMASEFLPLERLSGMEIFNNSSETDLGKGLTTLHWDDALARGKRWWGYAVDDTHWINDDAFGGWLWVKAERLTEQAILQALRDGAFYSSGGPKIHDFRIEDGIARVRCSDAVAINLIGHTQWGTQRRAAPGETIREAEHVLRGKERYLRAECIDAAGHRAWTNPIFLGEAGAVSS